MKAGYSFLLLLLLFFGLAGFSQAHAVCCEQFESQVLAFSHDEISGEVDVKGLVEEASETVDSAWNNIRLTNLKVMKSYLELYQTELENIRWIKEEDLGTNKLVQGAGLLLIPSTLFTGLVTLNFGLANEVWMFMQYSHDTEKYREKLKSFKGRSAFGKWFSSAFKSLESGYQTVTNRPSLMLASPVLVPLGAVGATIKATLKGAPHLVLALGAAGVTKLQWDQAVLFFSSREEFEEISWEVNETLYDISQLIEMLEHIEKGKGQ